MRNRNRLGMFAVTVSSVLLSASPTVRGETQPETTAFPPGDRLSGVPRFEPRGLGDGTRWQAVQANGTATVGFPIPLSCVGAEGKTLKYEITPSGTTWRIDVEKGAICRVDSVAKMPIQTVRFVLRMPPSPGIGSLLAEKLADSLAPIEWVHRLHANGPNGKALIQSEGAAGLGSRDLLRIGVATTDAGDLDILSDLREAGATATADLPRFRWRIRDLPVEARVRSLQLFEGDAWLVRIDIGGEASTAGVAESVEGGRPTGPDWWRSTYWRAGGAALALCVCLVWALRPRRGGSKAKEAQGNRGRGRIAVIGPILAWVRGIRPRGRERSEDRGEEGRTGPGESGEGRSSVVEEPAVSVQGDGSGASCDVATGKAAVEHLAHTDGEPEDRTARRHAEDRLAEAVGALESSAERWRDSTGSVEAALVRATAAATNVESGAVKLGSETRRVSDALAGVRPLVADLQAVSGSLRTDLETFRTAMRDEASDAIRRAWESWLAPPARPVGDGTGAQSMSRGVPVAVAAVSAWAGGSRAVDGMAELVNLAVSFHRCWSEQIRPREVLNVFPASEELIRSRAESALNVFDEVVSRDAFVVSFLTRAVTGAEKPSRAEAFELARQLEMSGTVGSDLDLEKEESFRAFVRRWTSRRLPSLQLILEALPAEVPQDSREGAAFYRALRVFAGRLSPDEAAMEGAVSVRTAADISSMHLHRIATNIYGSIGINYMPARLYVDNLQSEAGQQAVVKRAIQPVAVPESVLRRADLQPGLVFAVTKPCIKWASGSRWETEVEVQTIRPSEGGPR